jgi:dolichol-phosphate mannosyltransferase
MNESLRSDQISLVMPAFNEEAVIVQAVREAELALSGRFDDFEVLIVDDGSSDRTAEFVASLLAVCPHTRLIRHSANRGYGAALRTGFERARFDLVAFTDADCQFHLAELVTLARLAHAYPIVAGYRVNRQDSRQRCFFSWGYNLLARMLLRTGLRDVDCALKVFRWEALSQILPETSGFFVNTEMMARARQLGLDVLEHPVAHRPRASGESKVSLREIPRTASRLLRFWWTTLFTRPEPRPAAPLLFQARITAPAAIAGRVPAPDSSPSRAVRAEHLERRPEVA